MSLTPLQRSTLQKQCSNSPIQYYDFLIHMIDGRQTRPLDEERLREMNFCKYLPAQAELAKLRLSDDAVRRIATDCRLSWLASTIASSLDHHEIAYTTSMISELVAQTTIYFHHPELPLESYLPGEFQQEKSALTDQLRPYLERVVASIAHEKLARSPSSSPTPNSTADTLCLTISCLQRAHLTSTELAEAISLIQRLSDSDILLQADHIADDLLAWLLGHWQGSVTVQRHGKPIFEARVGSTGSHLLYLIDTPRDTKDCPCRASGGSCSPNPSPRRILISRRIRPPSPYLTRITEPSSRESSLEPESEVEKPRSGRSECHVTTALKHMFQNIHISGNARVHLGDLFTPGERSGRWDRVRAARSDLAVDRARRVHRRALAGLLGDAGRSRSPIRRHQCAWRRGLLDLGRGARSMV